MPAWPSTLPQEILRDGFSESIQDQTIESAMESGRAKIRRRFTVPIRMLKNVNLVLTLTQRTAFETFYFDTLAAGSLTFTWTHPITKAAATMRFRNPAPQYGPSGAGRTRVTFNLEVM